MLSARGGRRVVNGMTSGASDSDIARIERGHARMRFVLCAAWSGGAQEVPGRVARRARALRAGTRVLVGARHARRLPCDDMAVTGWRVVAVRANIAAQNAPPCIGFWERGRAVTSEASYAAQSPQRARQLREVPYVRQ